MEQEAASPEAKRERIKAISRNVHSIPVEEGGQLRPAKVTPPAPPPRPWKRALALGGAGVLALGLAAGLLARRR